LLREEASPQEAARIAFLDFNFRVLFSRWGILTPLIADSLTIQGAESLKNTYLLDRKKGHFLLIFKDLESGCREG
jgi:hypothetical protein